MDRALFIVRKLVVCAVAACAVVFCAQPLVCQQSSNDRPLGDVARQVRQAKQQSSKSRKVVRQTGAAVNNSNAPSPAASSVSPDAGAEQSSSEPQKSVFDKRSEPDVLTVPAGTEIKVKVRNPANAVLPANFAATVVAPVRVGFSTAIRAASAVTVRFMPAIYVYTSLPDREKMTSVVELRSVVVDDVTYKVRTDTIPLYFSTAGLDTEVAFTLQEPLRIER